MRGLDEAMAHLQRARRRAPSAGDRHPAQPLRAASRAGRQPRAPNAIARNALTLALQLHGSDNRASVDARRQLAALHVDQGRYAQAQARVHAKRRPGWSRAWARTTAKSRATTTAWASPPGNAATSPPRCRRWRARSRSGEAATTRRCSPPACSTRRWCCTTSADDAAGDGRCWRRRARCASSGSAPTHELVGDTDRLHRRGRRGTRPARTRPQASLRSAVELTRTGYGPAHSHTLRAELSQARLQARDGDVAARCSAWPHRRRGARRRANCARPPGWRAPMSPKHGARSEPRQARARTRCDRPRRCRARCRRAARCMREVASDPRRAAC